jgi:hypothetical protein
MFAIISGAAQDGPQGPRQVFGHDERMLVEKKPLVKNAASLVGKSWYPTREWGRNARRGRKQTQQLAEDQRLGYTAR